MGNNVNITCFAIFDGGQEVGKWAIVKRRLTLCPNNVYEFFRNTYAFLQSINSIPRSERVCTCGTHNVHVVPIPLQRVLVWVQFQLAC